MKSRLAALVLFCVALAAPAAEIPGLTLTPVAIPTPRTVNPYRIGPGSNGRTWFSDVTFRQVGFIASSGAITAFKLVDSADPNNEVRPLAITEGPDGNGWFTISLTNSSGSPLRTEIGRVTPAGVITRFPTPTVDACRVFGRAPVCGITVGPDGNLWFTETQSKRIGKITLSGQITEYLADSAGGEFFYGITAGPDGNLWVADQFASIIRITPAGVITFFDRQGLFPVGITAGPDGNVWFTDNASNSIGRITREGVITLFPTPTPMSGPLGIVAASDGKLYFTETVVAAPKIGQIDPVTGLINESAVTGRGQLGDIVAVSGGSSGSIGIAAPADVKLAVGSIDPPFENVTFVTISLASRCDPREIEFSDFDRDAIAGEKYIGTIFGKGFRCPCTVSLSGGQLPPGLTLQGGQVEVGVDGASIEGTPTQAGTYKFSVTVTDSEGCTSTRELEIVVRVVTEINYKAEKRIYSVNGSPASDPNKIGDGDEVVFTITALSTTGKSGRFTITESLPPEVDFLGVSSLQEMTCSGATGSLITCSGDQRVGSFDVRARVRGNGRLSNCAVVNADGDTNPADNQGCVFFGALKSRLRAVRH